jgi:hypothetical protein
MASQQAAQEAEALLDQWFRENDGARALSLMETLVSHHAAPIIRRIVSFKLGSAHDSRDRGTQPADVEDVSASALYHLLARLARIKAGDNEPGVRNFSGYAAVIAYNACNEYFRSRKPAWVRLSMKLRYLVTHAPKFALWQTSEGRDVCGLVRDRGHQPKTDLAGLTESCKELWRRLNPAALSLGELVGAILDAAGAPLLLDDVVDLAAEWSGVKEAWVQSLDEGPGDHIPRLELTDSSAAPDAHLRERQYIEHLWKEICDLPLEHRKALLFNLQDSAGGDIELFDALGIATVAQIAAAVEMDPKVFAELWKKLPLDDISLGRQLGLSRQDVANRRSSARKRLARKMREFECGN